MIAGGAVAAEAGEFAAGHDFPAHQCAGNDFGPGLVAGHLKGFEVLSDDVLAAGDAIHAEPGGVHILVAAIQADAKVTSLGVFDDSAELVEMRLEPCFGIQPMPLEVRVAPRSGEITGIERPLVHIAPFRS